MNILALSEEIVQKLDNARKGIQKVYDKLNPEDYTKFYDIIWKARSDVEFIVATLKLLNNLEDKMLDQKWKEEYKETLKQVRAERKIRQAFLETLDMFNQLEGIEQIEEFYKICWKLKEKITILLNVVKPKIKLIKNQKTKKVK